MPNALKSIVLLQPNVAFPEQSIVSLKPDATFSQKVSFRSSQMLLPLSKSMVSLKMNAPFVPKQVNTPREQLSKCTGPLSHVQGNPSLRLCPSAIRFVIICSLCSATFVKFLEDLCAHTTHLKSIQLPYPLHVFP